MAPPLKVPLHLLGGDAGTIRPEPKPRWKRVLRALAIALLAVQALYLLAANLFLNVWFGVLFESTNSINATLGRAYTLWPGTVYVRDLRIVFQDHNLQWTLDVPRATLGVALTPLVRRTFHATSVEGEGAVFHMRHRVDPWTVDEPAVAALTQIPEFPGPAVFEARVPEAPISDEDYNLWTVHLEDVDMGLREAWVQQFRYVGAGRARGAFRLEPARTLWVGPATLDLEPGRLTAGSHLVTPALTGHVTCTVHPFDVLKPEGLAVLRYFSTRVEFRARELSPSFVSVFQPAVSLKAAGGELVLAARLDRGVLTPGSRIEVRQQGLVVKHPELETELTRVELEGEAAADGAAAHLDVEGGRVVRVGSVATPLAVERLRASAESSSADAAGEWKLRALELAEARISTPDARFWDGVAGDLRALGGSASLGGRAEYRDGLVKGQLDARLNALRVGAGTTELLLDGTATLASAGADPDTWSGAATGKLDGKRVLVTQSGSRLFDAGGVVIDATVENQLGVGRGKVAVKSTRVELSAGSANVSAQAELEGNFRGWSRSGGERHSELRGKLSNLLVAAKDDAFRARAKSVTLRGSTQALSDGAGRKSVPTRLEVRAEFSPVEFRGSRAMALEGQADGLKVESTLVARPDGALDGVLDATARSVAALLDRTRLRATPELHVELKGFDAERKRGSVASVLSVKKLRATDREGDEDCPWSSVEQASVRSQTVLRGERGARFELAAAVDGASVAWGDFTTRVARARLETAFDQGVLDARKGKLDVSLDARETTFLSGPGGTQGWASEVPRLTYRGELYRQGQSFGGPMQVTADAVEARIGATSFRVNVAGDVAFATFDVEKQHATGEATIRLRGLDLRNDTENVDDWWADVSLPYVEGWARETLEGNATFSAKFRDALPALSVLSREGELPGFVPDLFPLRDLQANGSVRRRCKLTEIRVDQARGGPFSATGRVHSATAATEGAFLVRLAALSPISTGIAFDARGSDISVLAGSGWLKDRYVPFDRKLEAVEEAGCVPAPRECGE